MNQYLDVCINVNKHIPHPKIYDHLLAKYWLGDYRNDLIW